MSATDEGAQPTVLVVDGGLSSQLTRHAGARVDGDPLWSARFLQTHPAAVTAAHLDFLRAGANVIITNTYQASIGGFVDYLQVRPEEAYALIHRAVDLAKAARNTYLEENQDEKSKRNILIAGSVGPYGAHLHDGSEYDGSYADRTTVETMREWHEPRITALVEAGVDFLSIETIPCLKEAKMLVDLLHSYPNIKAWLSFSCKDGKSLANGEDFKTVSTTCWNLNPNQLMAVGVNCCSPNIVASLFRGINDNRKDPIPFVAYPNSGEKYNPEMGWIDSDLCLGLDTFVDEWLEMGVRYIGGCCRTYDGDISRIRAKVNSWCENKKCSTHKLD